MGQIAELAPAGTGALRGQDRRRRSQRFPFHEELEVGDGIKVRGVTLDLSAGGVRAALEDIVIIGEECQLVVLAGARSYRQNATVAWIRPVADRFIVGFKFQ